MNRLALGGIVGAVIAVTVVARPEALSVPEALIVAAILLVGLLPTYWYFRAPDKPFLPLMAGIGLFHVIYFGLSFVLIDVNWPDKTLNVYRLYARAGLPDVTLDVVLATLLGVSCLVFGYKIALPVAARLPALTLREEGRGRGLRLLAWGLALAYFAILLVPQLHASSGLRQGADFLRLIVFGTLFLSWCQGRLSRVESLALFLVLLPFEIVTALGSGFLLSSLVHLCLLLAVIIWNFNRLRAVALIVVCGVTAVIVYEARHDIRAVATAFAERADKTATDYIALPGAIASTVFAYWRDNEFGGRDIPVAHSIGSQFGRRISYGLVLAHVMEKTPSEIPYWNGTTYGNILGNFVPRILWPAKPTEQFGSGFAHRYQLVKPDDFQTSLNIPWLIEAYVNYAWLGLAAIMAAIGALIAALEKLYVSPRSSPFAAVIGSALLVRLSMPESNFTVMTGSIPLMTALVYAYFAVGLIVYSKISARGS